jgi:hypothetical protein
VLFFLTDGAPNGSIQGQQALLLERLQKALDAGVRIFGFGVDCCNLSSMTNLFGDNWVSLSTARPTEASCLIMDKLREALL